MSAKNSLLLSGMWKGNIELPCGIDVPFSFEVSQAGQELQIHYINGVERVRVEKVEIENEQTIQFAFPSYEASIKAQIIGNQMKGHAEWRKPDQIHSLPFRAEFKASSQIPQASTDESIDLAGQWAVELDYGQGGEFQPGIMEFVQTGSKLQGTVETAFGDFRYLSGKVYKNEFFVSTFDGGHVMAVSGQINESGTLHAKIATLAPQPFTLTGVRSEETILPDLCARARLKEGERTLDFSLPTLDGTLLSPSDVKFKNKATIVILAGSWCPTCHDYANFFVPLYNQFHETGLEAIAVMFELSEDFSDVQDRLEAYKKRYKIPFEMVFAGHCAPDQRGKYLPQLNEITAFPTAIIIDRGGLVQDIIPSFKGPATGAKHDAFAKYFRNLVVKHLKN